MNKKQIFYSAFILVILCLICYFIYHNCRPDEDIIKTEILVKNDLECKNGLSLYYTDRDNRNYYLYCLEEIIVDYKDHSISLDRALETRQMTMDKLLNEYLPISFKEPYNDGGTTQYISDELSIIECRTVEGNRDYYFGPKNMGYHNGFCQEEPYVGIFTKTYQMIDISESNNQDYLYLTLKEYQGEEVVTVKVLKELTTPVQEKGFYEFTFASSGKESLDIKSVFDNHKLLQIEKTDLEGLDQMNEDIIK